MDLNLLWIIQLAPFAAFLLIQVLPGSFKKMAPAIGVLFSLTAAAAALGLFWTNRHGESLPREYVYPWLFVSDRPIWIGFLVDPLNLLMILLVATISFFVQLFSVYYMSEDPSRPRYFAFLSFFAFSMTGLVLSHNLLQTFLFWELVGLASYLLIGFWYAKPAAATAARKAFVLNRLGDLGFYLGVILLFLWYGTLNFTELRADLLRRSFPPAALAVIGVLVFMGVMGKSAQFPLHAWLPDAMEGPTPVSALIHSATMVAAGVFLLSRAFGLFSASETTLLVVLAVGALTAFTGAALATSQRDIKRILAYSTVSQLGLMVMAVGAGSAVSGIFHLSTHAYFKSLLFLTAGAFIHRYHTNDIWEIGRKGGRRDPLVMSMLALGLLSLCGIPPFSGFFSKDMILEALKERSAFFYLAALLVSFLTVYYSFRMFLVITLSKVQALSGDASPPDGVRFTEFCKSLPLLSLAAISLAVGFLGTPWTDHKILHWLGGHAEPLGKELLLTTAALIASGAALAWLGFRNPEDAEERLKTARNPIQLLLDRKFFVDDTYDFLVKKIGLRIAEILHGFDRAFVNGVMVNQTSYSVMRLGKAAAKLQNGLLQDYLSLAIGAGVVMIFFLVK